MVQTERRPSQVVLFEKQQNDPSQTKKCSIIYKVPIQLEWEPKVNLLILSIHNLKRQSATQVEFEWDELLGMLICNNLTLQLYSIRTTFLLKQTSAIW